MVDDFSASLIRLHTHYKNRILFTDGGISSQPNKYVQGMEYIEELNGQNND